MTSAELARLIAAGEIIERGGRLVWTPRPASTPSGFFDDPVRRGVYIFAAGIVLIAAWALMP
jgi:hypothetical protein